MAWDAVLTLSAGIVVMALSYFAMARLLKIGELRNLRRLRLK